MKIKDLIKELKKVQNEEAEVYFNDEKYGIVKVYEIKNDEEGYELGKHIVILDN